jgi:putative two-component system response regulator
MERMMGHADTPVRRIFNYASDHFANHLPIVYVQTVVGLNKKGKLDDNERTIMNAHPEEGARIILSTHDDLDLAAVVAYEHHIMIDGGGYPSMKFKRDCHQGSKLVHVCDVYDALRTKRPYRDAWPMKKVLGYMEEKAGTEFDKDVVEGFIHMMKVWEPRLARVDEHEPLPS